MANNTNFIKIKKSLFELDRELFEKIIQRIELVHILKNMHRQEGKSFSESQIYSAQKFNSSSENHLLNEELISELWNHIITFTKVAVDGKDPSHKGSISSIEQ